MTLPGSIAKLQNQGVEFYSDLALAFSANKLIHETWASMSQDLRQQVYSFQSLPHSFWNRLKDEEAELRDSIQACCTSQDLGAERDRTFQHSLARSLDFEEPLILKIYVPLIRCLRAEWSNQVLDFYIVVKAHVSRLLQIIRSFSGDPALIHRAALLLQTFEKEVQVPEEPAIYRRKSPVAPAATGRAKKSRQAREKPRAVSRRSRPLEKRSIPKQRETLVKMSRRARR